MGWLYKGGYTRAMLIADLTEGWTSKEYGKTHTCLRHTTRGNVLWSVWEVTETGERYIRCDLLQNQHGFGWGYKGMTEDVHPYYYTCPLGYLDMVSEVTCQAWRDKVREYHARVSKKLQVGDRVALVGAVLDSVKIVSVKPLLGIADNGRIYSIPRRMVGDILED